jgi:D-alanyl-D-alanine carboxypeptidase (penicillin-binding protein 5/6)
LRARLAIRVTGLAGGAILAACVAAAPASAASVARPAAADAGPAGVQARAAAIANASTGKLLWSRDLNTELPMGSITKVMTALVVIRAGDLSRKITISSAVVAYVEEHDASNAGLRAGDRLSASQLLEGLLLPSGCDAAFALAQAYGPGFRAFIAKMNATARRLGLTRTHFSNFDGLPWPTAYSTYSTAANLIRLGRVAMTSAVFRSIVDRRTYRIAAGHGHHAYLWHNLNPLIGVYRGAVGIKTGFTLAAGHCLLFEATRGDRSFIGVTLGSPGVGATVNGADATRLLNWAFSLRHSLSRSRSFLDTTAPRSAKRLTALHANRNHRMACALVMGAGRAAGVRLRDQMPLPGRDRLHGSENST